MMKRLLSFGMLAVFLLIGTVASGAATPGVNGRPTDPTSENPSCVPDSGYEMVVMARGGKDQQWQNIQLAGTGKPSYYDRTYRHTQVPVRQLVATVEGSVSWDDATRMATFHYQNHGLAIHFPQGSTVADAAYRDGRPASMYPPAHICNGTIYAHDLWVSNSLSLYWKSNNGVNYIEP